MRLKRGNPLKETTLASQNNQPNQPNMFNQFMQNPIQWLMQRRINIPQEYANNPQGAVQYLLNKGQMSQEQLTKLTQTANQMGVKL